MLLEALEAMLLVSVHLSSQLIMLEVRILGPQLLRMVPGTTKPAHTLSSTTAVWK